jgi:acyl carrier protein
MTAPEIDPKVRAIILAQADGAAGRSHGILQIELTDPLFESKLDLDSLDLVEICMSLEEAFEFLNDGIDQDDSEKWRTVGDVVRFVQEKSAEVAA